MRSSANVSKVIWIPRVLGVLYIVFFSVFSMDTLQNNVPLIERMGGLLIHLLPSFVLIALLILSWSRPLLGGFIFSFCSLYVTVYFHTYQSIFSFLCFTLPLAIMALLFFISPVKEKKLKRSQ